MSDLPDEIWEQVISFLPSTGPSLAHFSRVSFRFEQITRTHLRRKNRRFEKKLIREAFKISKSYFTWDLELKSVIKPIKSCEQLKDTRIDYLRGNLLSTNGPRARYQSSVAMLNNILYVFGGYVDSLTALNDSWYFSPKKETWDRVVCSKTPQAKGGAVMVADVKRERLILFGGKLSQLPQSALAAFRTGRAALPFFPLINLKRCRFVSERAERTKSWREEKRLA